MKWPVGRERKVILFCSHCKNPSPVMHVFVVCVCVTERESVCVCDRERERVCVCVTERVCVCVWQTERVSLGVKYILYKSNQQKTLLVHAGLFGCFHNPSNSDMDYVPMGSFLMRMYPHWGTSVYRLVPKGLYRVCTEFDSREISQLTQSLTNNSHPFIWWPRSIVLNSGFWVKQHANF